MRINSSCGSVGRGEQEKKRDRYSLLSWAVLLLVFKGGNVGSEGRRRTISVLRPLEFMERWCIFLGALCAACQREVNTVLLIYNINEIPFTGSLLLKGRLAWSWGGEKE